MKMKCSSHCEKRNVFEMKELGLTRRGNLLNLCSEVIDWYVAFKFIDSGDFIKLLGITKSKGSFRWIRENSFEFSNLGG